MSKKKTPKKKDTGPAIEIEWEVLPDRVKFTARDAAGNTSTETLHVTYKPPEEEVNR